MSDLKSLIFIALILQVLFLKSDCAKLEPAKFRISLSEKKIDSEFNFEKKGLEFLL